MATSEERMRILQMIQEKQITAEEGARLLTALGHTSDDRPDADGAAWRARWLRVRVTDMSTGKPKVNVSIPINLVDVGLKMGARFAPDLGGMDLDAIQAAIKQGMYGKIVEVEDSEDDERVEIFVE
jgi:hypothetical protein